MRPSWRLTGILLCLVLAAACDTTQPLQIESQTFEFTMKAVGAEIATYNVYDVYEDSNLNGQLDAGEPTGLFCQNNVPPGDWRVPDSVPWHFSIDITILRNGETEPEPLTGPGALVVGNNLTDYATIAAVTGQTPGKAPVTVGTKVFRFLNPRRLTAAVREVVAATSNPLSTADPINFGLGAGRCSAFDLGPARVDTVDQPQTIVLNKGDTILIKARRGNLAPNGITLVSQPLMKGFLTVNGREVTVRGNNVSTRDPAAGISFSFTSL